MHDLPLAWQAVYEHKSTQATLCGVDPHSMSTTDRQPECRYKAVIWNKRHTLAAQRDIESEPLPTLGAAHAWLAQHDPHARKGATILKEHDRTTNDGKFFLHLIVR